MNVLFLIIMLVMFYVIGLLMSVALLIESIADKKIWTSIIAVVLLLLYIAFGLGLI